MTQGPEWHFAERPAMERLAAMGYAVVPAADHAGLREGDNQVLFRPHLVEALMRINGIDEAAANAAFGELVGIADNEAWLKVLRGDYSRKIDGFDTRQTLRVIDFLTPSNNLFTVTSQLRVKAEKTRRPDLVIHVNGIPLVVIEAKSPLNVKDKTGEAFEQIKQYEQDIPRLFGSNAFNMVTDGALVLYGATGAPSKYYAEWRDPWPKAEADFADPLAKGLWCLLEPSRLLDLLAHYIVFEKTDAGTIKKMCRYQQFRAVNRMVARVLEGKHRQGLIWHTQGSGKSLTMVFAALKLKTHRTIASEALRNPNILVLTDRIDLHGQISGTFLACGLPNPTTIDSIKDLRRLIGSGKDGLTALSTIFKFQGSTQAVANSANWIVMVDEAHRTQEKDLGAALRATLPDARFFGFTGTPVKKDDKDTYANFGVPGEAYLDKYGIDDAVADGATVPIYYTGRKTDWQVDEARIDILFDTWFAELDDDRLNEIKKRGVQIEDLVKHPRRVELIAYDIWTHFKAYARPDGFKAQIVAIDREAVILTKRALTRVIADDLQAGGMPAEAALARADAMGSEQQIAQAQQAQQQLTQINQTGSQQQVQQAQQAQQQITSSYQQTAQQAQTLTPQFGQMGQNLTQLVGPLASVVPGLGQFSGALQQVMSFLLKGLGSFGGMGGGSIGLFHTGGVVGGPASAYRHVPAAAFAFAQRYHNGGFAGFKPNEVPAILQRRERVLTEAENKNYENLRARRADGVGALSSALQPVADRFNVALGGISVKVEGGSSGDRKKDAEFANDIAEKVSLATEKQVLGILMNQQRPGGLLYKGRTNK